MDMSLTEQGLEITLALEIFADAEKARARHPLTVRLTGVQEFAAVGAGQELVENHLFGQIAFARINDNARNLDLGVHLVGGYVRIVAEKFEVLGASS